MKQLPNKFSDGRNNYEVRNGVLYENGIRIGELERVHNIGRDKKWIIVVTDANGNRLHKQTGRIDY